MTEREAILTLLPDPTKSTPPKPFVRPLPSEHDLWAIFELRLTELGGQIFGPSQLELLFGRNLTADEDAQPHLSHLLQNETDDVWSADFGITLATCAVAETGTILIENAPGRNRLTSLAPPTHVCIVRSDQVVRSLDEAIAKIEDRTAVFITGPSRTADIAGTLIRGVHGPKELWVIRLPET